MRNIAIVGAIAMVVVGAGGWARSNVASADLPMAESVSIDIQALQAAAAKDLPIAAGDNAI
jgi:hypothetical protein